MEFTWIENPSTLVDFVEGKADEVIANDEQKHCFGASRQGAGGQNKIRIY